MNVSSQLRHLLFKRYRQLLKLVDSVRSGVNNVPPQSVGRIASIVRKSGLFDEKWYATFLDHPLGWHDLVRHYLAEGELRGLRPNSVFDPLWYSRRYGDCGTGSPLLHYLYVGRAQGRWPSEEFDPDDYLLRYPDVAAAGVDPVGHYLSVGRMEGRSVRAGDQASQAPGAWFSSEPLGGTASALERDDLDPVASAEIIRQTRPLGSQATVHLLHRGGGGTERHVRDIASLAGIGQFPIVVFTSSAAGGLTLLVLFRSGSYWLRHRIYLPSLDELGSYLQRLELHRVHIHQSREVLPRLNFVLDRISIPADVTIHDYSLICPRNSFVDVDGRYCGEPDIEVCRACVSRNPKVDTQDAFMWRSNGLRVLARADNVFCLTEEGGRRIQKYQPSANVVCMTPHEDSTTHIKFEPRRNEGMRVGVIGHCAVHKGGDFLLQCVESSSKFRVGLDWVVFGSLEGRLVKRARRLARDIYVTGVYGARELDGLLAQHQPNVIFFPQHCVETYSYALNEALATGLPVLVPDLGAFPERVHGRPNCSVYPIDAPAEVVVACLRRLLMGYVTPEA